MAGVVGCVDCKKTAPDVVGDTTLVSGMGWRLRRHVEADGTVVLEWRCPACWAAFKSAAKKVPAKP